MKRLIWLPVAGFLLIAGAAVAAAAPTITAVAETAIASLTDSDEDRRAAPGEFGVKLGGGDLLDQVLADLVEAGTITQVQSDAITDALATELDARRSAARAEMDLWQGFIEDGVITQDEVNQLPEDSPFREIFNSIAEEGEVSLDQLRELRPHFGHGPGPGDGLRWHVDGPPDADPEANPDSDTDTDSGTDSNS